MTVKRFEAKNMSEALRLIRMELGDDAMILETKQIRGGLWGIGGKERVEVLAGVEPRRESDPDPTLKALQQLLQPLAALQNPQVVAALLAAQSPAATPEPQTPAMPPVSLFQGQPSLAGPPPSPAVPAPAPVMPKAETVTFPPLMPAPEPEAAFTMPMTALAPEPAEVLAEPRGDEQKDQILARLRASGMDPQLIGLIEKTCEPDFSEETVMAAVMRRFRVAVPLPAGEAVRIALVGPTGVGKTTTAAKLAARYALTEKKRVALITMDTYRIGAVEQLKTYARVMGLPMEVVRTPDEMREAIDRLSHMDLLMIDTVGRSPRKGLHLAEIQAFLNAAEPAETYLTLAAPYGLEYLYDAAEQFAALEPNRLILTKLDEQPGWGAAVSLAERTGLPISYVTDGQEVPRNIRPADAAEIARFIVGGAA